MNRRDYGVFTLVLGISTVALVFHLFPAEGIREGMSYLSSAVATFVCTIITGWVWCFGKFDGEEQRSQVCAWAEADLKKRSGLAQVCAWAEADMKKTGVEGQVVIDDHYGIDTLVFHLKADELNDLQQRWFEYCKSTLHFMGIGFYVDDKHL
jgi:hypothetical protein